MANSPLAGKPATEEMLVDLARLEREYYDRKPDTNDPTQLVGFGTSGHRGSSLYGTFNESHIVSLSIFKDNDYYSQIKPFVMNLASSFYCMIHFNKGR